MERVGDEEVVMGWMGVQGREGVSWARIKKSRSSVWRVARAPARVWVLDRILRVLHISDSYIGVYRIIHFHEG